jgi:hypothetical protein
MSDEGNEMVEVDVDNVEAVTAKAILCKIGGAEHWMPKSQIDNRDNLSTAGDSGTILVPKWLVDAKKLDLDGDGEAVEPVEDEEVPF